MLYDAESGDFDIALAGDAMLTRRISVGREKPLRALRDLLQSADAVCANLEGSVRSWDEGTPGITVGTYMTTPPELLEDLKWMGVGMVSCANNHAFDYGEGGILATIGHLDRAGIAHAGSGRNLAEARAPGYLDTARGRVAMIAATATFKPWNLAGAQRPDMRGRPGINPFRFSTTYTVDASAFAELRRISQGLGFEKARARDRRHFFSDHDLGGADAEEDVALLGQRFLRGNAFKVSTAPDPGDMEGNLRAIAEARRQADWVVVSFHSHEFGGKSALTAENRAELEELADFTPVFARAAIDAGADVVFGHGPHTPLGVEIYKGRPILYSVGNFIFMNETVPFFPADAYQRFGLGPDATPADFLDARTGNDTKGHPAYPKFWQSVVGVCRFHKRALSEVRLYPIDLGHGRPRAQRGRPMLADAKIADDILDRLQRLSDVFGTRIRKEDGVGVIS